MSSYHFSIWKDSGSTERERKSITFALETLLAATAIKFVDAILLRFMSSSMLFSSSLFSSLSSKGANSMS